MIYKVQKGKLEDGYETILKTEHRKWAWKIYFKTTLEFGEKKRIMQDGKTLKSDRRYYTQGYGER